MNIDRFISRIRTLREAAPINSTGADIANFDKFLFPVDDDLITQDYQTPAELGLAKDEFLGVYPVMKLQLDKSSDGPSIDSMVDASKEFVDKMSENTRKNSVRSPLENIREIVRNLNEDAPVNSVGNGAAVSLPPAVEPGVDMRRKKQRNWNPFFKDMARVMRRNDRKNGK